MTPFFNAGDLQILALLCLLLLCAWPLGLYIARVLCGERTFLSPILLPLEIAIYALVGVACTESMTARRYILSVMAFSFVCCVALFVLLLHQDFPRITPDLAFNIAASYMTGTNWQPYAGETTLTNESQQIGLAVQNFLAGAVGMAVFAALARAFRTRHEEGKIGNFWVDLTRSTLYIFFPFALVLAIFLVSQGVVQSFHSIVETTSLENNQKEILIVGPVASQAAIKQLGTNGGGFYNVNAAHPFENATPLANFIQVLALLLIPAALTVTFGKMVGKWRHGAVLLIAMLLLFTPALFIVANIEQAGNPLLQAIGVDMSSSNMEGKEVRFGPTGTALMAIASGATSGGTANSSLDSFLPLASAIPLVLILLGEIVIGGVGTGLGGMLAFVLMTVFIASLMIGRTPEYLGKKVGVFEIKMASIVFLTPIFLALAGTALAVFHETGHLGATNPGPQGFFQIFYAYASSATGNGSGLGGIAAKTPFYNISLALCMLAGRLIVVGALVALAGGLASQKDGAPSKGALRTDTLLFIVMLIAVMTTSLMAYVPALALGPVAEHFMLKGGM